MKKIYDKRTGETYYALRLEDYLELREIETMLVEMARAAYSEEDRDNGNEKLVLSRTEIHFFYMEISMQIADALNGTRRKNVLWPESGVWQ